MNTQITRVRTRTRSVVPADQKVLEGELLSPLRQSCFLRVAIERLKPAKQRLRREGKRAKKSRLPIAA